MKQNKKKKLRSCLQNLILFGMSEYRIEKTKLLNQKTDVVLCKEIKWI